MGQGRGCVGHLWARLPRLRGPRRAWLPSLRGPRPWGLGFWKRSCYARAMGARVFVEVDPVENERRWYVVSWGPTLFGAWAVVCTWGRLGTDWSQRQVQEFETQDEAAAEAAAQIR